MPDGFDGIVLSALFEAAAEHPLYEFPLRRGDHDDPDAGNVQFLEEGVQGAGLFQGARKPIEQEPFLAGGCSVVGTSRQRFEHFPDQPDDDVIRNQSSGLDKLLGGPPQRGTLGNGGAENIAGRNVKQMMIGSQPGSLRAFPYARRSKENEVHTVDKCGGFVVDSVCGGGKHQTGKIRQSKMEGAKRVTTWSGPVLEFSMLRRVLFLSALLGIFLVPGRNAAFSQPRSTQSPTANLHISNRYFAYADSDIVISQFLANQLADSVQFFTETIEYNPNIVEFINARNGALTPLPDWTITKSVTTKGQVQITGVSTGLRLMGSGEILRLLFHVLDTVQPFQTTPFTDSADIFGTPGDPTVVSDTGLLRIVTDCTSMLTINGAPITLATECVPNPASGQIAISYTLPNAAAAVRISIFDLAGSTVEASEFSGESAGWHNARFDVSTLPVGTYFYRVEAGTLEEVHRLLVSH